MLSAPHQIYALQEVKHYVDTRKKNHTSMFTSKHRFSTFPCQGMLSAPHQIYALQEAKHYIDTRKKTPLLCLHQSTAFPLFPCQGMLSTPHQIYALQEAKHYIDTRGKKIPLFRYSHVKECYPLPIRHMHCRRQFTDIHTRGGKHVYVYIKAPLFRCQGMLFVPCQRHLH